MQSGNIYISALFFMGVFVFFVEKNYIRNKESLHLLYIVKVNVYHEQPINSYRSE
mgnify:CR=1 FL=1